jgi:uncharacterized protein YceH (UPF0502 family)
VRRSNKFSDTAGSRDPQNPLQYAHSVVELSAVEARVIGSLAEKQLTTPQQYPLTLNALVMACNQTSNRDPVVAYEDALVEDALSSLKEAGLLRFVHPGHGRSATRYRQVLDERFGLDARGLAILAVLLLRGPQTVGELRARTERMADFASLEDVEAELTRQAGDADPLVRRLARRPGQKEERWTQQLSGGQADDFIDSPQDASTDGAAVAVRSVSLGDAVASLRADIDALRDDVQRISIIVEKLRSTFDL